MKIKKEYLENGKEVDYTAHYRRERGYTFEEGRVSLRKKDGEYQLYVLWFQTREEEVLYHSKNLKDVVEWGNKFMQKLGYPKWEDVVEE